MRTKLRSRFTLLFMAFALMLALPAVALADNAVSDGDDIVGFNDSNMAMGTVCSGVESSKTAPVKVTRQGNATATNTFANGATVTVTASVTGAGLSAEMASPNTITLPSNWATVGNGAVSDSVSSTVKLNSSVVGAGSGSVVYAATGTNSSGATITRSDTMNVSWTTANCDTTAPTSSASATVPNGSGTSPYSSGAWTNQNVTVALSGQDNTGGSGLNEIRYTTDGTAPTKTTGTVYGAPFTVSSTTTVKYLAVDNAGNAEAVNTFQVNIDKTAPVIDSHGPENAEATGPDGAVVTYTKPAATDNVDASVTVNCSPASGSQFALGETTVTCDATDNAGNKATSSFKVTVADTTAPTLTVPSAPVVIEADSPKGAIAGYQVTAKDAVTSVPSISCTPASGSQFVIGTTQVTCTAKDAAGNTSAAQSFDVTVRDTTAPAIAAHADVTEEATGPNGALVSYTSPGTTDAVDGNGTATCLPASGSQFALGSTTVTCNATDKAGNKAVATTFTVKVQDTTAPTNIQFVGNISSNGSFFFGDVPTAPTCTADDAVGMKSCVVSGYSTAVGTHTLKATATDNAGNTATKEITYTVKPYTLNGFYQPIDMNDTLNTVKNGSTVPVKFELFKGTTELTSTSAVTSISAKQVDCAAFIGDPIDEIEYLATTGGTSLRYDATGGQFIYNWTTPKKPNTCYSLTMTAADGSSTLTAYFKLR